MRFFTFFICVFFLSSIPVHGQVENLPYEKWISMLSAKENSRNNKVDEVINEILLVDTNYHCEVIHRLRAIAPEDNVRVEILLMSLEALFKSYGDRYDIESMIKCQGVRHPEELLEKALAMSYELEDDYLIFQVYKTLTSINLHQPKIGQALLYGLLAKELYEKYGKEEMFGIASVLHGLAFAYYRSREYRSAIETAQLVLHSDNGYLDKRDTMHHFNDFFLWNIVGLAYTKLGIPDSAFIAFDEALKIAEEKPDPFWKGLIIGNKGDVYFKMGNADSAEVYLKIDYEASVAAREYDNAANSLQWLSRIDLIKNKPYDALQKVYKAHRLLRTSYSPDFMANTLFTYTKVFAELREADSVNYYLDKFLILHDSIEQLASDSRAANVLMRMKNQEDINTIKALNKEKQRIALIRNFIIVVILLSALIGFMILNRQKLSLKARRQEALDAKRIAEQESLLAKEQLHLFTRNLLEKTSLVETLQNQLMDRAVSEEQQVYISELSRHAILTDEDWENFKILFEKVYPGFFYSLKSKVADLTTADQRMAALSKLQLSNKEAATLLGIAPNSVIKGRQRLRHRLDLEPESDLEQYFAQSKEFN